MMNLVLLEDPEDYGRVERRIKKLLVDGEMVIRSHASARMRERGFDMNDVRHGLRYGQVIDHSRPGGLWRFTVRGKTPDENPITCVVEINGRILLVTVI